MFAPILLGLIAALPPQPPQGACTETVAYRLDLGFLASDELAGRGCGTPQDAATVRYLARRMADLGLEPALADGEYVQRFSVADIRPRDYHPDATGLEYVAGGAQRIVEVGREALPFAGSGDGDVRGDLVFAGYGLRIEALDHDDYRDLDVRDRIVLVLRGAPGWRDSDSPYRRHAEEMRFATKMRLAREAGAVGFVLCNSRWPDSPEASDRELRVALRARGDAGMPAMWVTRHTASRMLGCDGGGLDSLQERLDAGERAEPCDASVRVRLRVGMAPPHPDLATANVLGVLRGVDEDLADEFVVVGAHHDHIGRGAHGSLGGPSAVGEVHPGADDNASGVAGMLLAARHLIADPPRRSVLFAAFGAQELDSRGAAHLLSKGPVEADRIVAMINLDMIGRARTGLRIEGLASGAGWQETVAESVRGSALAVALRDHTSKRSDHLRFAAARVPTLLFHTGLHAQYHRPADVESLVQIDEAVEVSRIAARVVRVLADAEARVRFRRSSRR